MDKLRRSAAGRPDWPRRVTLSIGSLLVVEDGDT
jgi:hypothetical protein